MAQPMSSHEEISTELLRGLGHSILTMIVLLPWFFHEVVWKVDLFFKEDRIDFGGAALTLLSSHFSLLLTKSHLLCCTSQVTTGS